MLGYLPHLDGCVTCRAPFDDGEAYLSFSSQKGGAVCGRCASKNPCAIPVALGTARLLAAASRFDSDKLKRLKTDAVFLKESEIILDDFIRHILGKELKTKRFIAKLAGASVTV